MLMEQFVASYLHAGRLVLIPHVLRKPMLRHIFATEAVQTMLCQSPPDVRHRNRHVRARQHVDTFTEGLRIAVRFPPSKSVVAHTALLDQRHEEIWEMRARDPSPGIRIFGRFAARDKFIALTWDYKENCQNDEQYEWQKRQCERAWISLFVAMQPHTGSQTDDYISNAFPV